MDKILFVSDSGFICKCRKSVYRKKRRIMRNRMPVLGGWRPRSYHEQRLTVLFRTSCAKKATGTAGDIGKLLMKSGMKIVFPRSFYNGISYVNRNHGGVEKTLKGKNKK